MPRREIASYSELASRLARDNVLFAVMLELTYRCNLDCFYCYNDLGLAGEPLSTDRYLELLGELRELGVLHLVLTGGEPLAHPDFFRLGARARELGFVVRVKSNGHALRGAIARRLKLEVDPFVIDVSLHGATASTHDRQTRVPGSFERLLANLAEMKALGLRVKLNCTLTRWNEDEIEEVLAIADRLGFTLGIHTTVSPRDDGDSEPLAIQASPEARLRVLRLLDERSRAAAARGERDTASHAAREADAGAPAAAGKSCGAGSATVTVDPYGRVLPCVQWRRPVGDLRRETMTEIWQRSTALREVREITGRAGREIVASPGGELLDFCPGLAQLETGDPLTVYPSALEQRDLLERVAEERTAGHPALRVVG